MNSTKSSSSGIGGNNIISILPTNASSYSTNLGNGKSSSGAINSSATASVSAYTIDSEGIAYCLDDNDNDTDESAGTDRNNKLLMPKLVEFEVPPNSLYILMGPWRYNYNHAILGSEQRPSLISPLENTLAQRTSIIFRDAK